MRKNLNKKKSSRRFSKMSGLVKKGALTSRAMRGGLMR